MHAPPFLPSSSPPLLLLFSSYSSSSRRWYADYCYCRLLRKLDYGANLRTCFALANSRWRNGLTATTSKAPGVRELGEARKKGYNDSKRGLSFRFEIFFFGYFARNAKERAYRSSSRYRSPTFFLLFFFFLYFRPIYFTRIGVVRFAIHLPSENRVFSKSFVLSDVPQIRLRRSLVPRG